MQQRQRYNANMSTAQLMTAEELFHLKLPGKRTELVRGVLVVREPPGYLHGAITADLAYTLTSFVHDNKLGRVLAAETGFKLTGDPDTVRAADISFISRERLPDPPPAGYAALAPDLVVEVLSPSDRPGEVLDKIGDWLEAGCRLVWVVDPKRRNVRIYRANGTESLLTDSETMNGEDVLPGFACPVGSFLQP
jgi:Uma2 family endonuclease